MSTTGSTVQIFPAHSLPLASVTVFDDRAEVVRIIKTTLKSGINEICVQNISKFAVENSIKVKQCGNATVKEVNVHKTVALSNDENQLPRLKALNDEKKKLVAEQLVQTDKEELLKKQVEAVDKMLCEASGSLVKFANDEESAILTVEDDDLKALSSFLEFYMHLSLEKRETLHHCEKVKEEINEKISKVTAEIQELEKSRRFTRNVTIVLDAAEDEEVEVNVSYQVWHASWFPSYDIRLMEDEKSHNSMKITYYGKIEQRTGEDWLDAPIFLSTAKPVLGGNVPELGTLCAKFYVPPTEPRMFKSALNGINGAKFRKLQTFSTVGSAFAEAGEADEVRLDVENEEALEPAMATATDVVLSTTFKISRPTTILSGSGEHKVVVTVLELEPKVTYETVPCRDKNVYIVASAINTSSFPFLAGETSIYVGNSFVSRSNMKSVSPDERFQCVLGVEPAINIDYKPAENFSEQVGMIAKSTSKTHEQKIIVKNSKQAKALLTVRELVPKSTDEKIKIRLFSPELSQKQGAENHGDIAVPSVGARLDQDHNLEWTFYVEPNSEAEKIVKWTVEYPTLEPIIITETPLQHVF